jgi:Leucine-rich repeat (LRR) protein
MKKPEYIKEHFGELGYTESIQLLKEWINYSNNQKLRQEALEFLGEIDNGTHYEFFEALFLSDENLLISLTSGKILNKNYEEHDSFLSLLQYTIENVESIEKKLFAIDILRNINSKDAHVVLLDFFGSVFSKLNIKPKPIEMNFHFGDNGPIQFSEFIEKGINILLYDYFIVSCGYKANLQNNIITSLNCKDAGLTRISNIAGFSELINLEKLILNNNKISEISDISHLKRLKYLDLSHNEIIKIENLQELSNLETLNLSNNKIDKIENLDYLTHLKTLNLASNKIHNITNLDKLIHLKKLNLSFNKIEKMKGLDNLTQLNILLLNNNKIKKIKGLDNLRELKELYLNYNLINEIQGIKFLKNLIVLLLDNNNITHFYRNDLDPLTSLNFLSLNNNPLTSESRLSYYKKTRLP